MTTEQIEILEIEFLEPSELDVYDIEVENNHNFFVHGRNPVNSSVLVSNCIVPLEMTATQTLDRLAGILSGQDVNKISQKRLSSGEKAEVKTAYKKYVQTLKSNKTVYSIYEPPEDVTIEEVLLTLKPRGYKVILIDYISLLKGADGDDQWKQLGRIARFAKVFAKNNNCFAGSEKLLTKEYGNVEFKDVVGQNVTVLTKTGWEKAEVKAFGKQKTQTVTFQPMFWHKGLGKFVRNARTSLRHNVQCTPDHRWLLTDGSQTTNLTVGDIVPSVGSTFSRKSKSYTEGLRHGIIFGDGTSEGFKPEKNHWSMRIPLCGDKAEKFKHLFKHFRSPLKNGDPLAIHYTDSDYKCLPATGLSSDYYAGFIEGWIATDGHTDSNNSTWVSSQDKTALDWLIANAPMGGFVATGNRHCTVMETNYGKRKSQLSYVTLKPASDVAWCVETIDSDKIEQVYCAVVPKSKAFTLSGGIYTGNCIVVLLCQVSEEGRIRYANAIAEHSNNAWIWTLPGEESETSIMDIKQLKARNQLRFNFQLISHNASMRITDLDDGPESEVEDDDQSDNKTGYNVQDGNKNSSSKRRKDKGAGKSSTDEEPYLKDLNDGEESEDDEDD